MSMNSIQNKIYKSILPYNKRKKNKLIIIKKIKKCKKKTTRRFLIFSVLTLLLNFSLHTCSAAGDPLAVVNNLSTFIFGLIRAIGMILLGFGIVQVGLSLKSHDPSQRANGFLTLAGGIIITFAKEILDLIVG